MVLLVLRMGRTTSVSGSPLVVVEREFVDKINAPRMHDDIERLENAIPSSTDFPP